MQNHWKPGHVQCTFANQDFESLYQSITTDTATHVTEAENWKKLADLKSRELNLKEQFLKLCVSLLDANMDGVSTEEDKSKNGMENDIKRDESTRMEVCM